MFTFKVVVCLDDVITCNTFAEAFSAYKKEITNRINSPNGLTDMELCTACWIEVIQNDNETGYPLLHMSIVERAHQENLLKGN